MIYKNNSKESGYIALMSAIIIASVLMVVVFSLSYKGFMTRFNLIDTEFKRTGSNLAEACANTAILRIIENQSYAGNNEVITFGNDECSIVTVTGGPLGPYNIRTRSYVPRTGSRRTVSNIEVVLSAGPNFTVISWMEVPKF